MDMKRNQENKLIPNEIKPQSYKPNFLHTLELGDEDLFFHQGICFVPTSTDFLKIVVTGPLKALIMCITIKVNVTQNFMN